MNLVSHLSKLPFDDIYEGNKKIREDEQDSTESSLIDSESGTEKTSVDEETPEKSISDTTTTEIDDKEITEAKKPDKRESLVKFLKRHTLDVTLLLIVLIALIGIILLSRELAPDPNEVNPTEIIGYETDNQILIFVLSIIGFWLILFVFSKLVFFNRGQEFGVETWSLFRKIVFFIITLIFVSSVYMLFDVAVINVFLLMGSNTIIWSIRNDFFSDLEILSEIPTTTDRLAYADLRQMTFTLFYLTLLVFPVTMFLVILSRTGRTRLLNPKMGKTKYRILKKLFKYASYALLILGIIIIPLFFIAWSLPGEAILFLIFLLVMGLVGLGIIFSIVYIAFKVFDVVTWFTTSNLLLLAPIILTFLIFPVFAWTIWDIFLILDTSTLNDTIYTTKDISFVDATLPSDYDLQNMELGEQISFFGRTLYFNLFAYQRILMLDFVIIIGLAAGIIGLAEGYSIVAILRTLFKGVSVVRTRQIATEAPSKIVLLTTRLFLLAAWLGLVWDNFLIIWHDLLPKFDLSLPEIKAPGILEILQELATYILDIDVLIPIGLLIIPLYFIVSSSLKFFSVTIVSERFKHDANLIFLLTSSAYVLIVTAIFGDMAAMEEFQGDHKPYLPLSDTPILTLLPDIIDIIEMILAMSFYIGVFVSIVYFLQFFKKKLSKKPV